MKASKFIQLQMVIGQIQSCGFTLTAKDNKFELKKGEETFPFAFHSLDECQSFIAGYMSSTKRVKPTVTKVKKIGFN